MVEPRDKGLRVRSGLQSSGPQKPNSQRTCLRAAAPGMTDERPRPLCTSPCLPRPPCCTLKFSGARLLSMWRNRRRRDRLLPAMQCPADSLARVITAIGIDISQSIGFNRERNLFVERYQRFTLFGLLGEHLQAGAPRKVQCISRHRRAYLAASRFAFYRVGLQVCRALR